MRSVVFVGALLGCYQPTLREGAPCVSSADCPSAQQCFDGTCRGEPAGDAGADATTPHDTQLADALVPPDGPAGCAPPVTGAFAAPALDTQLSSPDFEGTPAVSSDLLEVYFKSTRPGGMGGVDLWRATRATPASAWTTPAAVVALNSGVADESPELSADGLTIWFTSNRTGSQGRDIWRSTRPSPTSLAWTTPVRVPELSSSASDEGLFVHASGLVAYLHSDRDRPSGSMALLRSTRTSVSAAWSTPVPVPGIDPVPVNENPWVSADDCSLYFHTGPDDGESELVVARRATPAGPFGVPAPLTSLNAVGAYDADPWLSPDERTILFVSNRVDPVNDAYDIYSSSR